ncbi:MAG TPA: LytR C-terminal domain-containing protein [Balneolaceae bacterium]|nr:LytR C-terminal domain-containing protein [Balneolaceae bacterium]
MKSKEDSGTFALNAVIGFLGLLLCVLLVALFVRIIYPRIQNKRAGDQSELISDVIQLEVLNGCGVAGVASSFTRTLRKNGFDVVETGNFENYNMEKTTIISRTINKKNAKRVADALDINYSQIIIEASENYYLDATIVIGADYESLNIQ